MNNPLLACFGKLPIHADFIRFQANGEEIHALDRWFQEGIHLAKARLGPRWAETYDNAPSWQFIFHRESSPFFLIGLVMPSHDQSGRSYPFFLYLKIDKKAFGGPLSFAPLCFSSFLKTAHDFMKTKGDSLDLNTFLSRLRQLDIHAFSDLDTVRQAYLQNIKKQSTRQFWEDLFGDFKDPRKYELDQNLIDLLHPMRGRSASTFRFALKFPLISQYRLNREAEGLDIPYWFDCIYRVLTVGETPIFFWHRNNTKHSPAMLTFFSPPPPKQFFSLLQPGQNNDAWFNLVSEENPSPENIREGLRADRLILLEDETLTMEDFLAARSLSEK